MVEFGVERNVQEYWLNDLGYKVIYADGLGASVDITKSNNATGTGYVTDSINQSQRVVNLKIVLENPSAQKREELFNLFPVGETIKLLIYNGSRTLHINTLVQQNEPDIFSSKQVISIKMSSETPFFTSDNKRTSNKFVTTSSAEGNCSVENNGEVCGFNIVVENNSSNAVIDPYFRVGSSKLAFSTTVPPGAVLRICTIDGKKSAQMTYATGTSTVTTNLMPSRVDGSGFPKLYARGTTIFYCGCGSGLGSIDVYITYNEQFNFV